MPVAAKPLQDPHPNLILGGGAGPRAARLAALWADEYNVNFSEPEACRDARQRLSEACERAGRDPSTLRFSLMTGTLVGEDDAELEARARWLMDLRGDQGQSDAFLAGLGDEWLVGTPERVLEQLSQLTKAGVERVMLQHLLHDDLEAVALIGQRIIPEAATL